MSLNPEQFEGHVQKPGPYANDSVRELHHEHKWQYQNLVGLHQEHELSGDAEWPSYAGHGSSIIQHEGIIARAYKSEVSDVEDEFRSRGRGVPRNNLSNLSQNVANPDFLPEHHPSRQAVERRARKKAARQGRTQTAMPLHPVFKRNPITGGYV